MIQDNKFIIENQSDLTWRWALTFVSMVVDDGKISKTNKGEQYSFATTLENGEDKYIVYCFINEKSYRFIIRNK